MDEQRIALVETRIQGNEPGIPAQLVRYQFRNHLGSATLELDDQAQTISYEEYTPYGSTSYQAVRSQTETPKRYRYTGQERDGESGLYYHGARYYAPWTEKRSELIIRSANYKNGASFIVTAEEITWTPIFISVENNHGTKHDRKIPHLRPRHRP